LPPGEGETIHQAVDLFDGAMLGLVRQVSVSRGGEDGMMAEELLHFDQIDAGLDQMGGVGMPQAVGRNLFFKPQAWTT
jgi:hypothetical protein